MNFYQLNESFTRLFEDIEDDTRYRNTARRYVRKLIAMRDNNELDKYLHTYRNAESYLIIPGKDIDNALKGHVIVMAPYNKRPAEGVYAGIGEYSGNAYDKAVVIYNMSKKLAKTENWLGLVLDENRLIHEFIHLFDEQRSSSRLPSINADGSISPEEYYNNPHEFNAYYQEGISELEDTLSTMQNKIPDFYEEKLSNWKEFYRFAKMRFDDGFLQYLNSKYRRKLEKRLYAYYTSLKTDLEETVEEYECYEPICEAEYQGRKVKLNKPMQGDVKKFKVYVRDGDKVKKINFGDKDMRIKKSNPERRKSFRARHKCDEKKDKTTAAYWSCKKW